MPPLHLHILDARHRLTALQTWITDIVQATHDQAARQLPLGPLDVVVQTGTRVIPEKGHVGFAPQPGVIFLTLDPENPALAADADHALARMIAHELHHAARWDGPGYGRTLGEALVSEGLAGAFARALFGPPPEPWEALPAAQLDPHRAEAERDWTSSTYDHSAWFFGTADKPRWLGYSLGAEIVDRYLANSPADTAASLAHAPADLFRPGPGEEGQPTR